MTCRKVLVVYACSRGVSKSLAPSSKPTAALEGTGEEEKASILWSVQGVSRSILREHGLSLDDCLDYMKIEAFDLNSDARAVFVRICCPHQLREG